MKANRKQTAVKLTANKTGTHAVVRVVNEYGKYSGYSKWSCNSCMNF